MAKTIAQLERELQAARDKASKARKKLNEAKITERKKQSVQQRKNDTRRKIIMGGFLQFKLKQNSPEAALLYKELLHTLEKPQDRTLFGLDSDIPEMKEERALENAPSED